MKIDRCIKNFLESYDNAAMESIDAISKEYGLVIHKQKIGLFNIGEAFDTFSECLQMYGQYQLDNIENEKKLTHDQTFTNTLNFIESKIFKDADFEYADLPDFVSSYINGINKVTESVDTVKNSLASAEVAPEYSADINEFTDKFIDIMDQKFTESMNKILRASGYTTNKNLHDTTPKNKAVFV